MNTIRQLINLCESADKWRSNELEELTQNYKDLGVRTSVYEKDDRIFLYEIRIAKESRNQGLGSAFMKELVKYADTNKKTIFLTPSKDFGATSVSRLIKFYSRFGFKRNKGRNKDFTSSEAMIRTPIIKP